MMSPESDDKFTGENFSLVKSHRANNNEEMKISMISLTMENNSDSCDTYRKSFSDINFERTEIIEGPNINTLIKILDEVLTELSKYTKNLKTAQKINADNLSNSQISRKIENIKLIQKLTENLVQFDSNSICYSDQKNIINLTNVFNKNVEDFECQDMKFKGYFDEAGQNGYGLIETNNYKYIGFIENRRAAGTGISIYKDQGC